MKSRRDPIAQGVVQQARGLRAHPATAERTAWRLLRNRQLLGLKFRRQHPIKGFVVDFYCAELRLVLEIDGSIHAVDAKAEYDKARTSWLAARGIDVVRIPTQDVSKARLTKLLQGVLCRRSPSPHCGEGDRG